jgi:hypothetical protein
MERLNTMAVNERAREALLEIGEEPNAGSLHCVQLVNVVLNREEMDVEGDVAETAKAMMDWRPERVVNFLMITDGEEYGPQGWERAKDYRELAKIILDDIEARMVKHFPWYRSGEE